MPSTLKRSWTKAITWRATSTGLTTLFVYLMTHEVQFAVGVLVFDVFVMTGVYFLHERIWKTTKWGKY